MNALARASDNIKKVIIVFFDAENKDNCKHCGWVVVSACLEIRGIVPRVNDFLKDINRKQE